MNRTAGAFLVVLCIGCEGIIGDPPASSTPISGPPTAEQCRGRELSAGATPLRRLSRAQYETALRDLFDGRALPSGAIARIAELTDGREGGFAATTSSPGMEATYTYVAVAEELAADLGAEGPDTWLGCPASEAGCVRSFIERFGRRAFRRLLAPEEAAEYETLYSEFAAGHGAGPAFETLVTAMLASPRFIYVVEPIDDARVENGVARLDGFAVATRLSLFLWSSVPDEALLDAAEAGNLDTAEGLAAEVRRMYDDPKTLRTVESFHAQWLELDELRHVTSDDPAFDPSLPSAMHDETMRFADHVVRDGDGLLSTLLTASYTYGDASVAALYGATPDAEGRIELDPSSRAGILTQASFLARFGQINPEVHRGRWIRAALLCDLPPPPPPDIEPAGAATRLATEPCVGCHRRMDPIGFGFAAYDSLGRFDPESPAVDEIVQPPEVIDDLGNLDPDVVGRFSGVPELAARLAASDGVRACVATQWFRYATGRSESDEDGCGLLALTDEFDRSNGDIRQLIVDIATSETFSSRAIEATDTTEAP